MHSRKPPTIIAGFSCSSDKCLERLGSAARLARPSTVTHGTPGGAGRGQGKSGRKKPAERTCGAENTNGKDGGYTGWRLGVARIAIYIAAVVQLYLAIRNFRGARASTERAARAQLAPKLQLLLPLQPWGQNRAVRRADFRMRDRSEDEWPPTLCAE